MSLILLAVILLISFYLVYIRKQNRTLRLELANLHFDKKSQSSRYGKMSEQFMPFLADYPYNANSFRFIGTPIDGIQFEPDKIVFIEFKTAKSQLSPRQKEIRNLVADKKVIFKEFRIS